MRQLTVIVATYYERLAQLLNTLDSFRQYDPDQFKVIIVDDNSPNDITLPGLPFDVTILKLREKTWINPCIGFNIGFNYALKLAPAKIIIQNAECYHRGDILGYVQKNLTDSNYLSFAAYSLSGEQDIHLNNFNARGATGNGDSAWYNHSRYRPEALHFCTAITSNNLIRLNGFDESFAQGLGYEDNYWIHQVRTAGLKIEIIDDPFVLHQYHYGVPAFKFDADLYNRTGALCREMTAQRIYRAKHYITPDLCM